MNASPRTAGRSRDALAGALVAGLAVAAFARSLAFGFVWDDGALIPGNPLVRGDRPAVDVWSSAYFEGSDPDAPSRMYRPLPLATFRLEWALWGGSPAPFHAGNVALHAACALLVFAVGRRAGAGTVASALAASAFAVSPLAVEPAAWIAGRTDLLWVAGTGLFLVAAGRPGPAAGAVALLGGLVAAFSKEGALLLLPAAGAGLVAAAARGERARAAARVLPAALVPVVAVLACRLAVFGDLSIAPASDDPSSLGGMLARVGTEASLLHGFDARALPDVPADGAWRLAAQALGAVVPAGLAVLAFGLWRRGARLGAVLVALGLLALLPVATVRVPASRYLYAPLACWLPVAALGLDRASAGAAGRLPLPRVVAGLVVAAWAAFTQVRLPAWASDRALFATEAELQPDNPDALYLYASELRAAGRPDAAIPVLERALRVRVGHRPSWLGLAGALLEAGRPADAERAVRTSLRGDPKTWPQFVLLGAALEAQGRPAEAVEAYRAALGDFPGSVPALRGLARSARAAGLPDVAAEAERRLGSSGP